MPEWRLPDIALHLVTPPGSQRPARVRVLIDFLARHRARAPWSTVEGRRRPVKDCGGQCFGRQIVPPGPITANSMPGSSGKHAVRAQRGQPCGTRRSEWGITPSPARAAAVSPLSEPLVKATRHGTLARSSVSSASARVTLGGG
jgi:hypothetical protein